MANPAPSPGGYTLVELLIVVTMIGILAALAVPRMDLSRIQSEGAVQSLGTTLVAAQRAAISKQHAVVVAFDVASGRIRIHEDANNNGHVDSGERVRFHLLGTPLRFARGAAPPHPIGSAAVTFTRLQDGLPAVTFHRNGSASEEGGFYLTARADRAVNARAVMIDRGTGRISWYRYRSSEWTQDF